MPLPGAAFLALWNDVARAREPEYDRWHTFEHVPERVAVTGFLGARRYVNRARERHRYFTLYEVAGLAVFAHPEYVDLVRHPTPWTAAMRPDFANFLRAPCRVTGSQGDGIGAALALLCFARDEVRALPSLPSLAAWPGVVACHVGERADGTLAAPWPAPPPGAPEERAFDHVVLLEALDRAHAQAALSGARESIGLAGLAADFGNDVYDFAFAFPGHDAAAGRAHRRPHWDAG